VISAICGLGNPLTSFFPAFFSDSFVFRPRS
jgi:hypothetical protein